MATLKQHEDASIALGELYRAALQHPDFYRSQEERNRRNLTKGVLTRWKRQIEKAANKYALARRVCDFTDGVGDYAGRRLRLQWRADQEATFPIEYLDLGRDLTLTVERHRNGWDGGFHGRRAPGCPFKTRAQARRAAIAMARSELRNAITRL